MSTRAGGAAHAMSAAEAQRILTAYTTGNNVSEARVIQAIQVAGSTGTASGGASAKASGAQTLLPAWGVRLAVKAALQIIKKRSVSTYNTIISKVNSGQSAFVGWYTKSAPGWVKTILPGVAVNAIYDAIKWVIGL